MVYERDQTRRDKERLWSEVFQESAIPFIDQLLDDNEELFEELARH